MCTLFLHRPLIYLIQNLCFLSYLNLGLRTVGAILQVVLVAVMQDGGALAFAAPKLQADASIVQASLTASQSCWPLRFAGQKFLNDSSALSPKFHWEDNKLLCK